MNKKVLTLCAGFLLAGGMLSSVSAEKLSDVADNGKYYLMKRVAEVSTDGASAVWSKMDNGYFISLKDGVAGLTSDANAKDYWKVISFKKSDGKTYYQLVNLEGTYFYVSQKDGESTLFYFDFTEGETTETPSGDVTFSQLFINDDYSVGQEKEDADNDRFWALALRSEDEDGWKEVAGEGFSAEDETNLYPIEDVWGYYPTKDAVYTIFVGIDGADTELNNGQQYKVYDAGNGKITLKTNDADAGVLYAGAANTFIVEFTSSNGAVLLKTVDGKYVSVNNNTLSLVDSKAEASLLAFQLVGERYVLVSELNYFEKDGFSVTIKHKAKDTDNDYTKTDIDGNPFIGHLTPMAFDYTNGKFVKAASNADNFYLKNSEGQYIVVTKNATEGAWDREDAYEFTTVSEAALTHDLVRNQYYGKTAEYLGKFQATVSSAVYNPTDLTMLESLTVCSYNGYLTLNVGRLDIKGVPTLVASQYLTLKPIQIILGSDLVVNPADLLQKSFFTVTRTQAPSGVSTGILAVTGANDYGFVKSIGNELEGQWALTLTDDLSTYVFTNRENMEVNDFTIPVASLYKTNEKYVYRYSDYVYEIKPVAEHAETDGYQRLTDLKNTKYHIAFSSAVFDNNAYFTENHGGVNNHTIGLDTDIDNALTFTATEYSAARAEVENTDIHRYGYTPSDSIYVISTLGYFDANGNYKKDCQDTLKVVSYSFVNQYGEPLIYHTNRYVSSVDKSVASQKFALREDGEKLNLRPIDFTRGFQVENAYNPETLYQIFNNEEDYTKVYAGDAANGILDDVELYDRTENDLFVVEETEKPMYRRVVSPLDTVSIFRDGNNQSVLFESKGFLGMENLSQFPNIAPGMIADTAYIGNGDTTYYRPQYLLAVDAIQHGPTKWCPEHGYGATCQHAIDIKGYLEGRFLVNLKDTAIAWDEANKHKDGNPYINSENFYRLGFVQATHRNDSLIIANDNNRIYVGDENYNVAKFAFRYVDDAAGSFVIETADYVTLPDAKAGEMKPTYGYLKWMNNVVVVVDDIKDADVYNMNEAFEGNPTANEEISANAAVSVVATDGAVIVKGAEGKSIVVSTILGKVVANEVLNSDNETIAAPAGIVVVSVDGESFKVAVK